MPEKNKKSPSDTSSGDLKLLKNPPKEKLIKSKKRVKKFGEVFTPADIVAQMCDLCEPEISKIDGKVFEPTCGNGNFLVEILRRKLAKIKFKNQKQFEFEIMLAISNIYAVDIQVDNVRESRARLKDIIFEKIKNKKNTIHFLTNIDIILNHTIIIGNTLTDQKKLLFYDLKPNFKELTFEISKYSLKEIEETYAKTKKAKPQNLAKVFEEFDTPPEKQKPKRKVKPRPKLASAPEMQDGNHKQEQMSLL